MKIHAEEMQKVTVMLPKALVRKALKASGHNLTGTIREGLQDLIAAEAWERLQRFRGKVRFSIDVDELREDRDIDHR